MILIPVLLTAQITINAQQFINKSDKSQFFIENKGQWPKQVKFLARLGGMNAWITDSGVVYDYYQITRDFKPEETLNLHPYEKDEFEQANTSRKGHVVRMDYKGINLKAEKQGTDKRESYYNFFIGNDSTKWASFVGLFGEVLVKEAYRGIDIRYYFDSGQIRYDYLVKPGAEISQINFRLTGANDVSVNKSGELIIKTILGEVKHGKLFAYQQSENEKREVSCRFEKKVDGSFGVIASGYEKGLALVIDPLVWSTFIGGSGNDERAQSITLDHNNNVSITGWTLSANYPSTQGAYQTSRNKNSDIFITKLNSSASLLIYSTFIGGTDIDEGNSIATDVAGNAYVTGSTHSVDFPCTTGAFDQTCNDTINLDGDVCVVKLNSGGSGLVYSTYLGGEKDDEASSLVIDNHGYVYITGRTDSKNFPTTSGAYNQNHKGFMGDVFVTKLNITGSAQVFSTYIGGSTSDMGRAITLDSNHNICIAGYTASADFPITSGVFDQTFNFSEAFVTKLNSFGSALIFSTFIGGSDHDNAVAIVLDDSMNIYVTGETSSHDFPTTPGAYKQTYNATYYEIFVSKINNTATKLISSTFLGGNDANLSYSIARDIDENIYLTGLTNSTNFPVTPDAFNMSYGGNSATCDAFISKFEPDLSILMYSTYLGGDGADVGQVITVDSNIDIYIAGFTSSVNFPTTPGAYDRFLGPSQDVFVSKLDIFKQANSIRFPNISCSKMEINWEKGEGKKRIVFMKEGNSGYPVPKDKTTYFADTVFGSGSQIGSSGWYCIYNDTGTRVSVSSLKFYTVYRIMVLEDTGTTGNEKYVTESAFNNPINQLSGSLPVAAFSVNAKQQYLSGNNFVFSSAATTPKNNMNFYWDFGDGDTSTASNPVHSYSVIGSYKVKMIATSGTDCADTIRDSVYVVKDLPMVVSFTMKNACVGETVLFKNTSSIIPPDTFLNFHWDFGDGNQTIVLDDPGHIYYTAGTYIITLEVLTAYGNKAKLTDTIEIYPSPTIYITALPDTIAIPGRQVTLTANGTYDQLLWWNSSTQQAVIVLAEGKYWVTATLNNGCKSSDTIEITLGENKEIEIVNLITPNGDGINDQFVIKPIEQIQPCSLAIYNRWGDELYATSDYQNNWEGTYKGKTLPEGTYYFVVVSRDGQVYKGAINILK